MRTGNLGRNEGSSFIVLPKGLLRGKKKRPPKTKVTFEASYIYRNVFCKSDLILISSADMILKRTNSCSISSCIFIHCSLGSNLSIPFSVPCSYSPVLFHRTTILISSTSLLDVILYWGSRFSFLV